MIISNSAGDGLHLLVVDLATGVSSAHDVPYDIDSGVGTPEDRNENLFNGSEEPLPAELVCVQNTT